MKYWLMKSEPDTFSIDDLFANKNKTECWDGVRNYQARNFMHEMKKGDLALFYHSNCKPPGVVGVVEIVRETYPDHTQFDKKSDYYDPKATEDKPRWFMVDIKFKQKFDIIPLDTLKEMDLGDFALTRRGNRLSVMPVATSVFNKIIKAAK